MDWNYRWIRYTDLGDEVYLHEVFYNDDGTIQGVTERACTLIADNVEGVPALLKMIEKDSTLPVIEMTTAELLNPFPDDDISDDPSDSGL